MRSIPELKRELKTVARQGIEAGERGDKAALLAADDRAVGLQLEIKSLERQAAINRIGRDMPIEQVTDGGPVAGTGLAAALLSAGWDRQRKSAVRVDHRFATDVRLKAGSLDGGSAIEDAVRHPFLAPPLGLDNRYLFPRVPIEGVEADATGITSYRQKSRTLATAADMVKAIDSTDTKEETATASEVVNEALKMIANVETGTPNILLANDSFASWVNNDLVAAYRSAVDTHIVSQITAAGLSAGTGGTNTFEAILFAQEVVRAAGYEPDTVVVSPADALEIQLLQLTGGDSYVFPQAPPALVITTAVADASGFVMDASALGRLFLGPFTFAVFEEANGTTNTSTVRAESSGLYLVQRPDAAAYLEAS